MWIFPYILLLLAFLTTLYASHKSAKNDNKKTSKTPILFALLIMIISIVINFDNDQKNKQDTKIAMATSSGVKNINQTVAGVIDNLDNINSEINKISKITIDSLNKKLSSINEDINNANNQLGTFKELAKRGNELSKMRIDLLEKELYASQPIIEMFPSQIDTITLINENNEKMVQLELFIYNYGNHTADYLSYDGIAIFANSIGAEFTKLDLLELGSDTKSEGLSKNKRLRIISQAIKLEKWMSYKRGYFIINISYKDSVLGQKFNRQYVFRYSATASTSQGSYKSLINQDVIESINQYLVLKNLKNIQ